MKPRVAPAAARTLAARTLAARTLAARTLAALAAALTLVAVAGGCTRPGQPALDGVAATPFPSVLPTRTPPPGAALDGASQPSPDPVYPEFGNPAIDVLHYELALDWKPDARLLTGTATLSIRLVRPVSEVTLDLSRDLAVSQATLDGAPVTVTRPGDHVTLPAGRLLPAGVKVTATIGYAGTPTLAPFPGRRSDVDANGAHIGPGGELWSMQEPSGGYTWFPCSDQPSDKALYDVAITAPNGWSGVSSGRFSGPVPAPGGGTTNRWHAREPVASYALALAVGRFNRHDLTGPRGIPVTLWVRPADEAKMLPVLRQTPQMLDWLEQRFGPYPFASAGVVVVPDPSAMETQTMVTMGQLSGTRGESVLLHELSHQWFGNAVTPRTWQDVWLNEGFATYVEMLYGAERFGTDVRTQMHRWWVDEQETRGKLGPAGRYDKSQFGAHNVYYGPALMLHEIRRLLGDAPFFAMLHDWAQHHRFTNQDRTSFTRWASEYTGRDLAPVIDKWLDSATVPPFPG